jgi:hypothetical protein
MYVCMYVCMCVRGCVCVSNRRITTFLQKGMSRNGTPKSRLNEFAFADDGASIARNVFAYAVGYMTGYTDS